MINIYEGGFNSTYLKVIILILALECVHTAMIRIHGDFNINRFIYLVLLFV